MIGCFSAGQCIFLFVVTEILIWSLLADVLNTIRHCVTMNSYSKVMGKNKNVETDMFFKPNLIFKSLNKEIEETNKKEEIK